MINNVIKDCMRKDYIECEEQSINSNTSDISLISDQEEYCNLMRACIGIKRKQCRDLYIGNVEDDKESIEKDNGKEDVSVGAEVESIEDEVEEDNNDSELSDVCFDKIEELRKN